MREALVGGVDIPGDRVLDPGGEPGEIAAQGLMMLSSAAGLVRRVVELPQSGVSGWR